MESSTISFHARLSIALLFASSASGLAAATLCVNPGGTSGCKSTISAAVTAANAGDVIQVWPGTYKEDVVITKSLVSSVHYNNSCHSLRKADDTDSRDQQPAARSGPVRCNDAHHAAPPSPARVNLNDNVTIGNLISSNGEDALEAATKGPTGSCSAMLPWEL